MIFHLFAFAVSAWMISMWFWQEYRGSVSTTKRRISNFAGIMAGLCTISILQLMAAIKVAEVACNG